jgi:predicted aspartyl protease
MRPFIPPSYRRALALAMLAAALAPSAELASASAPAAAPAAERVDVVLERIRERIAPDGGLERLAALRIEGVLQMDGAVVGSVETLAAREPRAMRESLELGGARQVTTLLGQEGWLEDANGSVRPASGDELTTLVLGHHLLFHRYLEGSTADFAVRADDGVLVLSPPGEGLERTLELDESFLPRLLVQRQHGTAVRVAFQDWRSVGGVLFPFTTVQNTGDSRFDLTIRTKSVATLDSLPQDAIPRPRVATSRDFRILDPAAALDIEFELRQGLVFLEVEVNAGRRASFLLDTGAGATVLSKALADELGLRRMEGRMEARGAGGSEAARFVEVSSLRLPGVELSDQTVVALPLETVSQRLGSRLDGILGYDFASRFAVEIDYAASRLRLRASGGYHAPEEARRVPLRIEANVPRIEGVVEGRHAGSFILDTGNSHALILHSPFVKEHGLDRRRARPISVSGIGGSEELLSVRIESLALGDVEFEDVEALISTSEEGIAAIGESIGNVGGGLFRDAVLAFDYSEGALWVTVPAALSASVR